MNKKLKTNLLLLTAATIWGFAFVAQQVGMGYIEPSTFAFSRFVIGAVALLPVIVFFDRRRAASGESVATDKKTLFIGALCCGLPLGFASAAQQNALLYSPAGKVGFLTALYILFVPIISIFLKKKAGIKLWIGVAIAVVGMYLLCMTEGFSLSLGDSFAILCSLIYSIQILEIDHFSPKLDGVKLSCGQFLVAASVNAVLMLLNETPTWAGILSAAVPLLYVGILSSGVAYTLQIIAQKDAEPSIAALIMSLESVFSVLGGWLILDQVLTTRETFGCILMFIAIVLAQLPEKTTK